MNEYNALLSQYRPSQTEYDLYSGPSGHHVVILAVFDHDWEQHLLVQQCSTGPVAEALGMNEWQYAFYYVSGSDIIHVRTFFDAECVPFVEAAEMVAEWVREGHYGGTQNAVESDIFD